MIAEIKTALEMYLAQQLNQIDGEYKYYTTKGGGAEDSKAVKGEIEPPFGIVSVREAEEISTGSNVYRLEGTIVLISHMADTGSGEHSIQVKATKEKLDEVQLLCANNALVPSGFNFALHGIDISTNSSRDSVEDKAHADAFAFVAGATQLPELTE